MTELFGKPVLSASDITVARAVSIVIDACVNCTGLGEHDAHHSAEFAVRGIYKSSKWACHHYLGAFKAVAKDGTVGYIVVFFNKEPYERYFFKTPEEAADFYQIRESMEYGFVSGAKKKTRKKKVTPTP